jgi:hypothetical protein
LAQGTSAGPNAAPEPVPAALRGPSNAALAYWRLWDVNQDAEPLLVKAGEEYKGEASWAPGDELVKLLEQNQGFIGAASAITFIPDSDWGVDYDKGFMALLPHLGKMRRTVRVLACDARRLHALGKTQESAERVAAILRMGEHVKVDRLVISALVSASITRVACDEIDVMDASGKLDAQARLTILAACREVSDGDPFNARTSWVNERDMMTAWVDARFTGDDAGKRLVEYLQGFAIADDNGGAAKQVSQMNEAALKAEIERLRQYYDAGLAAWDSKDPHAGFAEATRKVEAGEYGPLTRMLGPATGKFRTSYDQVKARLDATIAKLSK